jgi:hypothetical protein
MSAKPNLQPTLRALLDRDRRGLDEHPTPETLEAYHAGDLPAAEQDALRDHLALCHDCADLLLDLVSFAEFTPQEQIPVLADGEVEGAWQKLQPRLVAREEPAPPALKTEERLPAVAQIAERRRGGSGGEFVPRRRLVQAYAMAAGLFLGVVGLSVWGLSLKRQVGQEAELQVNIVTVDAVSEKDRTRSGDDGEARAPGQKRFILDLAPDLADPKEYSKYAAEIFRAGVERQPIANVGGLVRSKDGSFSSELSGKLVPPGAYRVDFYGVNGSHREKLDTLTFTIAAP